MLASEEMVMTTIKSLRQSSKCAACGEWLIAPKRSTYVSEEQVSNLWVCPKCGNEFETSIYLAQEVPLTPEVVDTFFPTLLVA
jgi:ribosomal protein L37AE/L43A